MTVTSGGAMTNTQKVEGVGMRYAQLLWTGKHGEGRMEQGEVSRLAKKLETLRRPATLWLLDDKGKQVEKIGGCEETDAADDRRIKWNWWYDHSYTFKA